MNSELNTLGYSAAVQKHQSIVGRFFRHLDWGLLVAVLLLSALGLAMIYSASARFGNPEYYLLKQAAAFSIGMIFLLFFAAVNYQIFAQNLWKVFCVSLSLLMLVLLVGSTNRGSRAWIVLGPVMLQPAEVSKLLAILVLSSWCEKHWRNMRRFKIWGVAVGIMLAHIFLILMQPDFGSTLVYFPILVSILFVSGAPLEILLPSLSLGVLTGIMVLLNVFLSLAHRGVIVSSFIQENIFGRFLYEASSFGFKMFAMILIVAAFFALIYWFTKKMRWRFSPWIFIATFILVSLSWVASSVFVSALKEYQLKRLIVFFNPQIDPMGSGYHVIQSIIALGSGKVTGKGFLSGTQGQLGFLPEQHTDFIFSVLGEEFGFLAANFVILLYAFLVWRSLSIAAQARDIFGTLVALGIGTMFAFYAILNLSMVMGLAPITGLPLPFFSYGGSALVSSLAAIGILLSIRVRRFMY